MDIDVRRGDIFFIALDPVFGREIGGFKTRPVVVVSINDINNKTRLVTVVPGTSTAKPQRFENVVAVLPEATQGAGRSGLTKDTSFQCHQVRAVERGRFTSRAIGAMRRQELEKIESALAYCLGLPGA